jgi:hypothetical protein
LFINLILQRNTLFPRLIGKRTNEGREEIFQVKSNLFKL